MSQKLIHHRPQRRKVIEQQLGQYPDVIVFTLDKTALLCVAANHSFEMVEFVDEPRFYLDVLKFKAKNS